MNKLVAIVGPTATGKSRLGIQLALVFNGEIVGADSRQIYRYMDIGTAKPNRPELSLAPHHLVDIINPDEDFSLACYQELASAALEDIQRRGRLSLLVGGNGLYVWAMLEGWQIPRVPPDAEYRRRLEEKAVKLGPAELRQELARVDPVSAERIDPRNIRRLIRALEVYRTTGVPFSALQLKKAPLYRTLIIGLTADRAELYRRIDLRVDRMIEQGLIDEVKRLVEMGYSLDLPAMSGMGYRQIGLYLKGELSLDEAIRQIKVETHRYARHQYNWFRLSDSRIKWLAITSGPDEAAATLVREFLKV